MVQPKLASNFLNKNILSIVNWKILVSMRNSPEDKDDHSNSFININNCQWIVYTNNIVLTRGVKLWNWDTGMGYVSYIYRTS